MNEDVKQDPRIQVLMDKHNLYQQMENILHEWKVRRFMISRYSLPNQVSHIDIDGQIYYTPKA